MNNLNDKPTESKEKIEFDNALKQRNFEIDLFWKRGWFFGALILAEVAAFYKLKTDAPNFFPPSIFAFITCVTALAQCLMNRGSKYWQERWEYMTMNREAALNIELTRLKCFNDEKMNSWFKKNIDNYDDSDRNEWFFIDASFISKRDNFLTSARRFSVSKLTFLVWDIIFICALMCWLIEAISLLSSNPDWSLTIKLTAFYLIVGGYIFYFMTSGNVYESYQKKLYEIDNTPDEKMKKQNKEMTTVEKISYQYLNNIVDSSFIKE